MVASTALRWVDGAHCLRTADQWPRKSCDAGAGDEETRWCNHWSCDVPVLMVLMMMRQQMVLMMMMMRQQQPMKGG